jgi:hypothetical protein
MAENSELILLRKKNIASEKKIKLMRDINMDYKHKINYLQIELGSIKLEKNKLLKWFIKNILKQYICDDIIEEILLFI